MPYWSMLSPSPSGKYICPLAIEKKKEEEKITKRTTDKTEKKDRQKDRQTEGNTTSGKKKK